MVPPDKNKVGRFTMKAFLAALVVMCGLAGGAMVALETAQQPANAAFATSGVRLN